MKAIAESSSPNRQVTCTACLTHARPLWVPWQQHAIGCPVRVAALGGLRRPAPVQALRVGIA